MRRMSLVRGSLSLIGLALLVLPIQNLREAKAQAEARQAKDRAFAHGYELLQPGLTFYDATKLVPFPPTDPTDLETAQLYSVIDIRRRSGDEAAELVHRKWTNLKWWTWRHPTDPNRWMAAAFIRDGGMLSAPFLVTKVLCGF